MKLFRIEQNISEPSNNNYSLTQELNRTQLKTSSCYQNNDDNLTQVFLCKKILS